MGDMHILDKAYKGVDLTLIPACRVVVAGSAAGEAELPGAANAGAILGVAMETQTVADSPIPVRKAGVALVEAAAAIAVGEPVNIAGTSGRIKPIDELSGVAVNCLGFAETAASAAGDLVEVFISLHERIAP